MSSYDNFNLSMNDFASLLGINNDVNWLSHKVWEISINEDCKIIVELNGKNIFYVVPIQVNTNLLGEYILKVMSLCHFSNADINYRIIKVCKLDHSAIALVLSDDLDNLSAIKIESNINLLSKLFYQLRNI